MLIGVLKRLLRIRPDEARTPAPAGVLHDLDALLQEASVLEQAGRTAEALSALERAVTVAPRSAEARYRLGTLFARQDRMEPALALFQEALALDPVHAGARSNLGNVLAAQGLISQACAAYRRALEVAPGAPEPWHNYGSALREVGDETGAVAAFDRALGIDPGIAETRFSRALALLGAGDLQRGWEAYERRFEVSRLRVHQRGFLQPQWRGEALAGRTLLVWGEQGVGDEITFASMFESLVDAGGRIKVECRSKLVPLFKRSFPNFEVIAHCDPPDPRCLEGTDLQIAAGSLGRLVRPVLDAFPDRQSYLQVDRQRAEHWRRRVAESGDGLKVGFSWRSSDVRGARGRACTRLDQWGELFSVPGVCWICLQYDDCRVELAEARQRFGVELHQFAEVDHFDDLDETMALTSVVDLVITAPTTVSVQSAALGVETWQMSFGADWQTLGTWRNPWLPAMIRYQRRHDQSWEEMLTRVATDLRERVSARSNTTPAKRPGPDREDP